jgi:copper oxidase (laccase) domain-containing protein
LEHSLQEQKEMPSISRFYFGDCVRVSLWGPDQIQPESPYHLAFYEGANEGKICLVKAPSTENDRGFGEIVDAMYGSEDNAQGPDVFAEGVVLTEEESAAIIRTADCATLVLFEVTSGRVVVTHAGRAALTPRDSSYGQTRNIVNTAYERVVERINYPYVSAYITGAICPHCFKHEGEDGARLIKPFMETFGAVAFADQDRGELDLAGIITHQLTQFGVPLKRITHDKICTHETPWLASYRRDRSNARNAVVVVKH